MPLRTQKLPDQNRIVASLASQCHMPILEMAALYEHERARLASVARVTSFLHIFATRNVLKRVRQRRLYKKKPVPVELEPAEPTPHLASTHDHADR
jgi:hypothetical protein